MKTRKPVLQRPLAQRDINDAAEHYVREAGVDTAIRFLDAVGRAFDLISLHPASGSPRLSHGLELPGLRCSPVSRFPYLVFYVDRADHVDVWRVLHGARDLANWLSEPGD